MALITLDNLDLERPVLIAGPTASGKSSLALDIATAQGRHIVNADALQVYGCWRVLSARPDAEDERSAPHALYGHVAWDVPYSVGEWLRALTPFLAMRPAPIIVGGTGLYFRALTEGLADIPATPPDIRKDADTCLARDGFQALLSDIDPETRERIDCANPARVQRAWEVLKATGRGLARWQDETPPPLLPLSRCHAFLLNAEKEWLNARIARRFDLMMTQGALEEVEAMRSRWNPALPSSKAIGAPELMAHLDGKLTRDEARDAAKIATRQYAKRQRSWFRARMSDWTQLHLGP